MRWNFRQSGRIDQDVVTTRHRLGELSLFSDASLANLIDQYPKNAIVVESATGFNEERRLGTIGNASGEDVLAMLRQGTFSVILKNVGQHSRPLRRILIRLNQEMTECSDSMRIFAFSGDLHLTSPGVQSPLRCDTDPIVRWQIRGDQTLLNYPSDIIDSHHHVQRIVQNDRDVAYRHPLVSEPSMEDSAWQSAVEAGSMQSMPQATPHRVIQGEGVGVTLINRYQTRTSINRDDITLSNHWILPFRAFSRLGGSGRQSKFPRRTIAAFVRRKAKQQPPWIEEPSFTLDSSDEAFCRPIEVVQTDEKLSSQISPGILSNPPLIAQPQLPH